MELMLSNGKISQIDCDDFTLYGCFKWYMTSGGYAARKPTTGIVYLHRVIAAAKGGDIVDHINGDRLDNRRENLRVVGPVENGRNRHKSRHNKSGVNGVYFDSTRDKWVAQYSENNKTISLGRFNSFDEAVSARQSINADLGFTIH